jgi:hypothetical protein
MRDWNRRKAMRLAQSVAEQRKKLDQLMDQASHHEHRAKHWDFICNRRGK